MKINWDSPAEEVRIEIVPLIDVIFCILTFFILAALGLTRQQAISVDLPKATTGMTQMREMLIVSIDPVGQTYVEKEPVFSQEELRRRLVEYRAQNPTGLMVLYASKTAIYEDVVQVLDLLRSVGGDRVALATLPGTPTQPSTQSPQAAPNVPPYLNIPGLTPLPNGSPANPNVVPNVTPGQLPIIPDALPTAPASPVPGAETPAEGQGNATSGQ